MRSELILKDKPKSISSENIRTIRTNLQFTSSDVETKCMLITSSLLGEGKSFVASNLAVAFAQNGAKTILVDCDLRRGRIHKIFNTQNEKGLSNFLSGSNLTKLNEYISKTDIPNLSVISRGPVPPNPSELLDSASTIKLIDKLREKYDQIIFDGPPLNGITDSLIIAKLVDRTAVVTCCNKTTTDELNNSLKQLENVNAKLAGVILNRVPKNKKDSYYYYN